MKHWLRDSLISSQNVIIADSLFIYKMVPMTGETGSSSSFTDKFSNTTTSDVFVKLEKVNRQPVIRPEYSRVIALNKQYIYHNAEDRADDKLKKVIQRSRLDNNSMEELMIYLNSER